MEAIYIPEDVWCITLSFFETRQLLLLRGVSKMFMSIINSNRIRKVVNICRELPINDTIANSLDKVNNIYYDIEDPSKVSRYFAHKCCHQIVRITFGFSKYLTDFLPYMTNLTSLYNSNQYVTGRSISDLITIRTLNLAGNSSINDEALLSLTNITSLCLCSNKRITNDCVTKLTNISRLHLEDNRMINDNAISCLTNITMLNLFHNKVITYQGVSGLTNIRGLDLQENVMIDDKSIKRLTNITYLNLKDNNKITNRSLTKLVNLTTIDLYNDKSRYTSLSTLPNLRSFKSDDGYLKFI